MFHWLKWMIVPAAILIACFVCAKASAQTAPPAPSRDAKADAQSEAKLDAERGENNPTHYAQPAKIAKVVRTVYICSQTALMPSLDFVERMKNTPGFNDLDLVVVNDSSRADVMIVATHIPWTFDYTAYAIDKKTSVHAADARVTAFNGYIAAIELSKELISRLREQRNVPLKPPKS